MHVDRPIQSATVQSTDLNRVHGVLKENLGVLYNTCQSTAVSCGQEPKMKNKEEVAKELTEYFRRSTTSTWGYTAVLGR